jgi:hypothetical protein
MALPPIVKVVIQSAVIAGVSNVLAQAITAQQKGVGIPFIYSPEESFFFFLLTILYSNLLLSTGFQCSSSSSSQRSTRLLTSYGEYNIFYHTSILAKLCQQARLSGINIPCIPHGSDGFGCCICFSR